MLIIYLCTPLTLSDSQLTIEEIRKKPPESEMGWVPVEVNEAWSL